MGFQNLLDRLCRVMAFVMVVLLAMVVMVFGNVVLRYAFNSGITRTFEERMAAARTFRVFPGDGVHTQELVQLVLKLDTLGYRGDDSLEVFNDDYVQMPLPMVAQRARSSALWLGEDVLRRSVPLPGQLKLRTR